MAKVGSIPTRALGGEELFNGGVADPADAGGCASAAAPGSHPGNRQAAAAATASGELTPELVDELG